MKLIALLPVFLAAVNAGAIRDEPAGDIPNLPSTPIDTTITQIEKPDVIVDDGKLYWKPAGWGSECAENETEKAYVCKIKEQWAGFGFETSNKYNEGRLSVIMKVSKPDDPVQIQCQNRPGNPNWDNFVEGLMMTDEYVEYNFTIPDYIAKDGAPVQRLVIQEGSNRESGDYNTFYIKKLVYYPPTYAEPGKGSPTEYDIATGAPTGTDPNGTPTGTDPSNGQSSGSPGAEQPSGAQPSGAQPSESAKPSGTQNTAAPSSSQTNKPAGDDSGSTTVKVLLFNIAVVQIIMMMFLM